mgnify:CR=1 FL=1
MTVRAFDTAARRAFDTALREHRPDFEVFFLSRFYGLEFSYADDACVVRFPVHDFMFNPQGSLHGGVTASVLDSIAGIAIHVAGLRAAIGDVCTIRSRTEREPLLAEVVGFDGGDFVVVVNAAHVKLTGRKSDKKEYFRHTGYMGHERFTPVKTVLDKHPERVIEKAVFGMLPKNSLAKQRLRTKLKVYAGQTDRHAAQSPKPFAIKVNA